MREQIRSQVERNLVRKGASQNSALFRELADRLAGTAEEEYDRLSASGKTDVEAYRGAMQKISDESDKAAAALKGAGGEATDKEKAESAQKEKKEDSLSPIESAAHAVLWLLTVAAYLTVSFIFGHWNMTWLLFLTAAAGSVVIDVIFDMNRGHTLAEEWDNIVGIVWLGIVFIYFLISFLTGAWAITWAIFIAGAAISVILDAVKKSIIKNAAQNDAAIDVGEENDRS